MKYPGDTLAIYATMIAWNWLEARPRKFQRPYFRRKARFSIISTQSFIKTIQSFKKQLPRRRMPHPIFHQTEKLKYGNLRLAKSPAWQLVDPSLQFARLSRRWIHPQINKNGGASFVMVASIDLHFRTKHWLVFSRIRFRYWHTWIR